MAASRFARRVSPVIGFQVRSLSLLPRQTNGTRQLPLHRTAKSQLPGIATEKAITTYTFAPLTAEGGPERRELQQQVRATKPILRLPMIRRGGCGSPGRSQMRSGARISELTKRQASAYTRVVGSASKCGRAI